MESCWANQRPGYRCRHGQTSPAPRPDRPRNAYVREDSILPYLPALAIRLTPTAVAAVSPGMAEAPSVADCIGYLRHGNLTLTYDPEAQTLIANTDREERIFIG
ncbi:hypothetical protein [Kitasatospora acidiphila]|uniref:hypothetical protein n=1 Tax=Kitasatospora acidiphila TaxID=2567942 RepID=UPI003C763C20